MSSQAVFVAALLDPDLPCPDDLKCWNGSAVEGRFAVYRNNVMHSLVEALADTFPVVRELVGDDFFRAIVQHHVRTAPPQSRILIRYGDTFPEFVASFPPASDLPYLADVARLELLRVHAYHAADLPPLDMQALVPALADPAQLPGMTFRLHPSVSVLESPFAIVSLWAAHQGLLDIGTVDPLLPESALVLRNGLDVEVNQLSPGASAFIRHLQSGDSFETAAQAAFGLDPTFDLGALLGQLLQAGAITHFAQTSGRHPE
ncbi:HvfC/BufC N-terminal domain-containing protein [Metapseudomonas boanensis]|uniref:DNA-binding domain-containing protein n=1 Tax=Metapseudomonas boanensis TaxID=2822138 RepID=A0ABS5XMK4_9GAMM|nr:DNA-binding domain-containing protein [Pseudomonas boanensis]MBT8768922.1 putative DNA-binding domain-containing protein [Pseudomonas boanensis]